MMIKDKSRTAPEVKNSTKTALEKKATGNEVAAAFNEFRSVLAPDMQPAAVPSGYDALISQWVRRSI